MVRIGIVASRFNEGIVESLLGGCLGTLEVAGLKEERRILIRVPGAWELPWAAQALVRRYRPDAVIALGAVIRGETDHYRHLARAVTDGLMTVGLDENVPVILGLLTTDTWEQALERSGGKAGHKGIESAEAALVMMALREQVRSDSSRT
jgi:6,7-dimethyl-8-ribityllumazine synthase